MRRLIFVKAHHNKADCVGTPYENAYEETGWKMFEIYWDLIEAKLGGLDLDWSKVKVYCESNFASQTVMQTVMMPALRKYAQDGSRQAQIVVRMVEQGAALMKTENEKHWRGRYCEIVKRKKDRDKDIADQINLTLADGETGILMLGTGHGVEEYLPRDIESEPLLDEKDTPELATRAAMFIMTDVNPNLASFYAKLAKGL